MDEKDADVGSLGFVVEVFIPEQWGFTATVFPAENNGRPVVGKCSYKVADAL